MRIHGSVERLSLTFATTPITSQATDAAYIGLDWADRQPDLSLYDGTPGEAEESVMGSQPDALAAWVEGLRERYHNAVLAVCLEQKRGLWVYALSGCGLVSLWEEPQSAG